MSAASLEGLNPAPRAAVPGLDGSCRVMTWGSPRPAPAITRFILHKIGHLIECGVAPRWRAAITLIVLISQAAQAL